MGTGSISNAANVTKPLEHISTIPAAAEDAASVETDLSVVGSVCALDSGDISPTSEEDNFLSKYEDPNYVNPKWPRDPPKVWEPFLEKFTLFTKLPVEIRQAVWKTTLKSRVVEVHHSGECGFWSRVKIPVALRVNKDSRSAVAFLYPLCFGSILDQPRIVFNFSMDTLFFDCYFWTDVPKFLISLKESELKQIQSIAVDHNIDHIREWDEMGENEYNNMECFLKVLPATPALKEFHIVYKIDEEWHEHGNPEGNGSMELFEEFPYEVQQALFSAEIHLDDEDGESECQELPNSDHMLEGFNVPRKGSIWGWRPAEGIKKLNNWFL